MSNWQTKYGRDELRKELKDIEATFAKSNLNWTKINRQAEDALAVTVDIIKRQISKGLIELKSAHSPSDSLYQRKI